MAKSNDNWLFGVVIALGIFFLVLVLTIFLKGVIQERKAKEVSESGLQFGPEGVKKGDYSLQQAYLVCKSKVESLDYLDIHSLRLDGQSSRFDSKANQFIVFLDVDIIRDDEIIDEFARCHISALDNSITEFRLKGNRSLFGGLK
ncbi:hypothetical protein [Marinicellulosiphila megalodicopiae]|uniref:hypothetical protein n=1 Tax=Marinicellulosiphila megalodicopiae TaxID=2724896 RepID=UPI003BB01C50